jgi:hypothetical protein
VRNWDSDLFSLQEGCLSELHPSPWFSNAVAGRQTIVLCDNPKQRTEVVAKFQRAVTAARTILEARLHPGLVALIQRRSNTLYNTEAFQSLTSFIITASYVTTLVESQVQSGADSSLSTGFVIVEYCYTTYFTFEICLNMCGHWWKPFFSYWPNIFDLFVVIFCIVALASEGMTVGQVRPKRQEDSCKCTSLSQDES